MEEIKKECENILDEICEKFGYSNEDKEGNKSLKTILKHVNENKDKYSANYGNITTQSIGTIERKLLEFENNNGDVFFGNPEIKLEDLSKRVNLFNRRVSINKIQIL